jgi:hypothetical protein
MKLKLNFKEAIIFSEEFESYFICIERVRRNKLKDGYPNFD